MSALRNGIRDDAIDSDGGEQQGDSGEDSQQHGLEAVRAKGLGLHALKRTDIAEGLIPVDAVDGLADRLLK